jgi:hypothetical protein
MAGTAYKTSYKSHSRVKTDRLFNITVSINARFVCATPVVIMMMIVVMTLMTMDQ